MGGVGGFCHIFLFYFPNHRVVFRKAKGDKQKKRQKKRGT